MQKVYYDSVNNKEVHDVSGVKTEADVISEFGLVAVPQTILIDESTETSTVTGTVLGKKTTVPTAGEIRTSEIMERFTAIDMERIRLLGDVNQSVASITKGGVTQSPTLHLTDLETEASSLRTELSGL